MASENAFLSTDLPVMVLLVRDAFFFYQHAGEAVI